MDIPSPLHHCAMVGATAICQVLLQSGANPNVVHEMRTIKETPLLTAIRCQHVQVARQLIEAGSSSGFEVSIQKPKDQYWVHCGLF